MTLTNPFEFSETHSESEVSYETKILTLMNKELTSIRWNNDVTHTNLRTITVLMNHQTADLSMTSQFAKKTKQNKKQRKGQKSNAELSLLQHLIMNMIRKHCHLLIRTSKLPVFRLNTGKSQPSV